MKELIRHLGDRHGDHERGASAVEFALVAPVFFLLIFGIVDFGLGIWTYNNLSQAVREGARYAIVRGAGSDIGEVGPAMEGPITCFPPPAAGSVASKVCEAAFPLDASKLTVTAEWGCGILGDPDDCYNDSFLGSNSTGKLMKVSATYVYKPFLIDLIPVTINLRSTSRMYIACCN